MGDDRSIWQWLPILIIFVIYWLFNLLSSRLGKRKQMEQPAEGNKTQEDILSLLSFGDDEEEAEAESPQRERRAMDFYEGDYEHADQYEFGRTREQDRREAEWRHGSPDITPDPVEPKWWGA